MTDLRRPAATVARRALCAGALFTRGFIERNIQQAGHPRESWEPEARRIGGWLAEHDLLPEETSRHEVWLLAKPLGAWSSRDIADIGWRSESIAVLLWALCLRERIAAYDQPVDALEFEGILPILGEAEPFVATAQLRSAAEIDRERNVAELWHWRSRAAQLQRARARAAGPDTGSIICRAAHAAHQEGLLPMIIGEDFPAFGRSYGDLGDQQLAEIEAITSERHRALSWVTGSMRDWDDIPRE